MEMEVGDNRIVIGSNSVALRSALAAKVAVSSKGSSFSSSSSVALFSLQSQAAGEQ